MASPANPRRTPVTRSDNRALTLQTDMLLQKGATFHSPNTPPASPETTFRPPSLPRRSQTNLDDVIDSHRRRIALTLGDIDKTFASSNSSEQPTGKTFRDTSIPIPRGVLNHTLDTIMAKEPEVERRILRPRTRRNHPSDSGLGSSVASTKPVAKTSAISRSAALAANAGNLRALSTKATNRIFEHTLKPLLAKPAFKEFHPLLLECPGKIQDKEILCLRDLEKTLLLTAPEKTKVADIYLDFCLTTIRCIQATVEYLTDREQTRPRDLPYTSGYFIDLVDQIRRYAEQLADAKDGEGIGDMDVDPHVIPAARLTCTTNLRGRSDEVKLHGGIHINGRPAELVRVKKNGKAYSMATGKPVEVVEEESDDAVRFKRSASQQAEDEEEIMRSMARRKKNASPEELAPKKCREPGCNKEFKRPCDLTKHEKTHSRPWKCPVPTCKYHEYGWPTEKEMDRHHNDKHSSAPPMYECLYKPCPYKSKRESNCKQHMEKAHGWTYVRTKSNGKKPGVFGDNAFGDSAFSDNAFGGNTANSTEPTPQLQNLPTPSSEYSGMAQTPPGDLSAFYNATSNIDFPAYLPGASTSDLYPQELSLDYSPVDSATPPTDFGMDRNSAYQELGNDFTLTEDIYGATVHLPAQMPIQNIYNKEMPQPQQFAQYTTADLCPPQAAHISPVGQGNTMLFTPTSLVDEVFDDQEYACAGNTRGGDFVLFPQNEVPKAMYQEPLFMSGVPTMGTGLSQHSQDFLNTLTNLDWSAWHGFAQ